MSSPEQAPADSSGTTAQSELHDADHGHDDAALDLLQGLGDPFAEGLVVPADPFVVPDDAAERGVAQTMPESPMDWVGLPPDPADLPAEWLTEQPAVDIEPSTTEELMAAEDGYVGGGFAAAGGGAELADHTMSSVPAPPTKDLPATLDAAPPWQYSYSCDPNNKPGMVAFANLVSAHYDRPTWYGSRSCKWDSSQHYEGRAMDWQMNAYDPEDKAIGDAVAQWLSANNGEMARRFGVQSIIWNRQSWYLYKPGAWYPYYGASPHTDHVHISFSWDGAMGRTSWWDGTPVTAHDYGTCRVYAGQFAPRYQGFNGTPCPTGLPAAPYAPYPVILPGANNNDVAQAQRYLGFTGSDVDGSFGPLTLQALLNYQSANALPWTGVLDKATWAYMIAAGIPSDPVPPVPPDPPAPPDPPEDPEPDPGTGVSRIAGPNRYATAAQVADTFPAGSPVFVTVGQDYPDALAAAARAGSLGGPVLLTRANQLPVETASAIQQLEPSSVTIVGGKGAISTAVYNQVDQITTAPVTRVGGSDRYETARHLAGKFGTSVDVVYVATGTNYPDALAGAARAGYNDGPVLLVRPDEVPSATVRAMNYINPYRVVVLGGDNAISTSVATQLRDMTRSGNLQRVAGPDRYATAAELASYYPQGVDTVVIATGQEFPDALSGAAHAGDVHGPVLLVTQNGVNQNTRDALARLDPQEILIVGGTSVIPDAVAAILEDYVG
ncbi:cell wall-binding repeat-containing protein [Ornithinimicrobium sp. F0845]|nr:cell wall-binding repeat-containing protein [Ornithinimicrobium sp. F0845]